MGMVMRDMGRYYEALDHAKQSLLLRTANDEKRKMASSYNTLSAIQFSRGKYSISIIYGQKAMKFAEENNYDIIICS